MDIKKRVEQEIPEIIKNMKTLVSFPSMRGEPEEGAPFGIENRKCLDAALEILDGYGFKTKNVDGYAGYAEVGKGEKLIGMVGHLDVVPVSDGWTNDPFTLIETEDALYGRGTSDDKGPMCCAIGALRIVNELRPDMNKRIRVVLGCNEESGSECIRYYVKKEGHFDYGFTPDASFPGIYGEKGMIGAKVLLPTTKILTIKGGDASNVVPGIVTMTLEKGCVDTNALKDIFAKHNIRYELNETDVLTLTVYGRKAHASTPDLGVNAILHALTALYEAGCDDEAVKYMATHFGRTCHGELIDLDVKDDYGNLTLNIGVASKVDDKVKFTIDIRFPVTMKLDDMKQRFLKGMGDVELVDLGLVTPLFFDPNSDLVQSLYQSYVDVTGDTQHKPEVIGGGTYAKTINNTIAFGVEFPNDPDVRMHGDDEFIPKANLAKATEIYVHALLKLLDL